MIDAIKELISTSGLMNMTIQELIVIIMALTLIYLAIDKEYEPYLLIPIGFGMLLANLPLTGRWSGTVWNIRCIFWCFSFRYDSS